MGLDMTATGPSRILTLDAVRGIAVMGILLMNIVSFAMPDAAYVHPLALPPVSDGDLVAWGINQLLFEGRMRGLFALLFGASTLLVMARADAAGGSPVATHLRRMAVLALFGAAHFLLLWEGDILLHYAILGMVLWLARDWPVDKLVRAAVIALSLHSLYWSFQIGGALMFQAMATGPDATPQMVAGYRTMLAGFPGPGSPAIVRDLAIYTGDYAGIVEHRLSDKLWTPWELLKVLGGESLGYMLIGMALMKSGLFTGEWPRAAVRRVMVVAYAVSLPLLALLTCWTVASGFDRIVIMGNFIAWAVPLRVLCALGHVALAVLLVQRFAASALVARIAAAGRMAFTNYLATSAVMTTIFYGYGLGLYGSVGRAELYWFVAAMWAAMLLWSRPWLDRFRYGPLEWLWRSLARGRIEALRRS